MGEARIKEQKRRQQAEKIVDAFEGFIKELIRDYTYNTNSGMVNHKREMLIDALVEPPPK